MEYIPQPQNIPNNIVAVFDFDDTLTVDDNDFGGHERIEALKSMFTELTQYGIKLAICTFNKKEFIIPQLLDANLSQYFNNEVIFDYEVFGEYGSLNKLKPPPPINRGWGKGTVINYLIMPAFDVIPSVMEAKPDYNLGPISQYAKGVVYSSHDSRNTLLFVDDDEKNISDVYRECPSCATLLTPSGGLQTKHMEAIIKWGYHNKKYNF